MTIEQEHTPAIVLSGGPCGGKTSIMSFLQQTLADRGIHVVTTHEAATDFITSGLGPEFLGENFQERLLEYIICQEDKRKELARLIKNGKKKVLLCDRGTMDAAAYMSERDFELMLARTNRSVVELRDECYEGVVFLQSVAVDKPELYTTINNSARREDVKEARALNGRTLAAWTGCPHLSIVDNSTDLHGKALRVLQKISRILGIPVPIEIERKFLVDLPEAQRRIHGGQEIHIVQFYLKTTDVCEVERIRARGQNGGYVYYHTTKRHIDTGVRSEVERQISRAEYHHLLQRADPNIGKIDKIRHCFVFENQYFELDCFKNPAGLTLLEIELTDLADTVVLPGFLKDHVKDVTGDSNFENHSIACQIGRGEKVI